MAKARKRSAKAAVKNNFITYNLKMVQMIFVLVLALFLVEYLSTQPLTDQAIAGELKGGSVCTDSDGPNYYNYGYVTYKNYRYYDKCIDTQRVSESICSNNKYRAVLYTCPYGCSGGKCNSQPTTSTTTTTTTVPSAKCYDSDGGINYYVKGTAISEYVNYTDYCWVDSDGLTEWLREYYCDSSGNLYISDVSCNYLGYYDCSDGACFYEPTTTTTSSIATTTIATTSIVTTTTIPNSCSDTDGGFVITTRGITYGYYSGSGYNYTDYCGNMSLIIEYYCIGNQVSNTVIDCYSVNSTSCSSGACVY